MRVRHIVAAALSALAVTATTAATVDAKSDWQSIPEGTFPDPPPAPMCGTIVTLMTEVFDREFREKTLGNGSVVYEERGTWIVDLEAADGRVAEDVDVGGTVKIATRADGTVIATFHGPVVVASSTPEEAALLAGLGLSDPFYFAHGKFRGVDATIKQYPRHTSTMCDLLRSSRSG